MSYHAERSRHFGQASSNVGFLRDSKDAMNDYALENEMDRPLDDFDQQLLSEIPQDRQLQASQGLPRISLPPRHQYASSRAYNHQAIRDDIYQTSMYSAPSSTTLAEQPSSPTVSVLQKRRSYRQRSRENQNQAPVYAHQTQSRDDEQISDTYPLANPAVRLRHAPPMARDVQLIPTSDLPDQVRSVFPYKLLNAMQSKCFPTAFHTDDNLVLSAPTGSGKTLVMELAISRLLNQNRGGDFKVVYQAPTKALCAERYRDWSTKFGILGLECAELTGDTEYSHLRQVQSARIIITTPEKWDSVTRKWRDQMKLIQLIKLFLVDEVHILKESRGATLEAVVSRMKSIGTDVRFVALSATVPNSDDIATWLGKNRDTPDLPAHREVFDESYRPVRLERHVYGFKGASNDFISDKIFMNEIPAMIEKHSKGKPTMIFCMTRKSALKTASNLVALFNQTPDSQKMWPKPVRPVAVGESDLMPLVAAGVAFHHAGLRSEDRIAIEQGFLRGDISIICSTSTLAVGVNLPCYLVILQGTMSYGDAGAQEYSDLEVMQMLGRAGRPQFERSACAVILTRDTRVDKYRKMVSGQQLLESTLHRNLIEHLNAEIGLGTIHDTVSAKRWLSSTFLYVRLGRNPGHYHLDEGVASQSRDEILHQICEKDISLLVNHNCVEQQNRLRSTEVGDAMARYYVKFETMKLFVSIPPRAKTSEILSVLAQAAEFQEVRFKAGERTYYKKMNEAVGIKFPVKVNLALTAHKVSIILQAELGGVDNPVGDGFKKMYTQHNVDKNVVFSHAKRLIRCIIDCQLHLKDAVSVRNALEVGRSIAARAWDNTPQQLREIPGVGLVYARKLAAGGISSIENFINTEPERIDLVVGKMQPFGRNLLKTMSDFPDLRIAVKEMGREIRNGKGATLQMKAEIGFINERVPNHFKSKPVSVIFVAEDSEGTLWDFRRFSSKKIQNGDDFRFTVELTKPAHSIRCSVMCDEIVGTLRYAEANVANLPAAAFPKIMGSPRITNARFSSQEAQSTRISEDTFGDDGLNDGDLLAAGIDIEEVEVVHSIDSYPVNSVETKSKPRKNRKVLSQKADKDEEVEYREPTQLKNGRWTCQHFCRDKGVECKHKCCIEGVANPKARPKRSSKSTGEEKGQLKITSTAKSVKKSAVDDRSRILDLDNLHKSAMKREGHASEQGDSSYGSQDRRSKRQRLPSISSGTSTTDNGSNKRVKPAISNMGQKNTYTGIELAQQAGQTFDLDDDSGLWTTDDCDWTNADTVAIMPDDEEWMESQKNSRTKPSAEHYGDQSQIDYDQHHNTPPVPFLSLADLERPREKGIFITGQSSSPDKTVVSGRTKPPAVPIRRQSHGTSQEPQDTQSCDVDWDIFKDDDFYFGQELSHGSVSQQPQEEDSPNQAMDAAQGVSGSADLYSFGKTPLQDNGNAKERAKRLWEEYQKKKWEGLDPWMYEQFHDIVELI